MKTTKLIQSVIVAALMAAGSAHAAPVVELLKNGSFEATTQAAGTWDIYSNVLGWTGGAAGIEIRNNVVGTASHEVNFVELDTSANSSITQKVTTVQNRIYTLTFDFQDRSGVSIASQGLGVSWGGLSVDTLGSSLTYGNGWVSKSYTLIGNGSAQELTFSALGNSDGLGTSLDHVSLTTAVPEPETYGMMLAGLAAIGFIARRRKSA